MYKKIGEFIRNAESFSLTEVGTHGSGGGDPWLAGTGAGRSPTTLVQGPTLDKTVHIVSRMTNKYAGAHIEFDIDRRSNSIPAIPNTAVGALPSCFAPSPRPVKLEYEFTQYQILAT
jgi:hypothetical protein